MKSHSKLSMIVWKTSLMMNEVYEEMTKKELDEFVEQMTTDQFQKVTDFFTTMPKLKHTVL